MGDIKGNTRRLDYSPYGLRFRVQGSGLRVQGLGSGETCICTYTHIFLIMNCPGLSPPTRLKLLACAPLPSKNAGG